MNWNRLERFKSKSKLLVQATVIGTMLFGLTAPALASNNIWYDKYTALESSIGNTLYTSTEGSNLAWGESYILNSYLDLYSLTGSTSWLDKFTTHADTIVANADDIDNDGYLGWSTSTYSPVEDDNWDFETGASGDSTLPANWVRFQSTSSTAYRSTDHAPQVTGSYGVKIHTEPTGTKWQSLYQQLNQYAPDTLYVLRMYAKTNGSAAKGRAYIRDKTTGTVIASINFENTDWEYKTLEFRTPAAAGHILEVWLGHQTYTVPGGIAYYDNVKVSAKVPYMVHDGMIGTAIAKFVRLIHQKPALQAAYLSNANTYQDLLEDHIIPRWESSSYIGNTWASISGTTGFYKQSTKYDAFAHGSTWTYLPYNQALAFINMLIVMYDVNGNATYLDRARKASQYFKNSLTANGTAYSWNYSYSSSGKEDTSHANIDLALALEMYRHGEIFTAADMDKFTDALTEHMWNGSLTAPVATKYVNGTGDSSFTKYMSVWTELSQFDKRVFNISSEQFRSYTPVSTVELLNLSNIMKWDRAKIVNQGFEMKYSLDATQPAQWNRVNATSANAYLDSTNKYEGSYGATIKANGSADMLMNQTWEGWLPSTSYTLTFMGKTDGSGAGGKVYIKNETTGAIIASLTFTDTTWTSKTLTFTSPATASNVVRTYIGNNNITVTNGTASFDNMKIKATADAW
ncbi:hypothetical protein [Paenibacillus koleovorans]|uniref:hypothetical protein n=1 Tax=Paenibacillus koleovorans TaxID=121608 RepID=UPI000FDBEAD2|nr:hypothetical protein [Paenibacillus koleovorans]